MGSIKRVMWFKNLSFYLLSLLCSFVAVSCMPSKNEIKKEIERFNESMKLDLGDGLTMKKMDLTDKGFIYIVECDEEFIVLDSVEKNVDTIKKAMQDNIKREAASDNATGALVEYCKKTGNSISYRFVGKTSGKEIEISVESKDM